MRLLRLGTFFLVLATAVFAQRGGTRGGGFGGGRSGGFSHGGGAGFNRGFGGFSGGGFRSGPGFRSGSGFRGSPGFYGRPFRGSRFYGSRFYGSRYAFSFGFGGYYGYPYFYDYGYYPYGYGYPAYSYGYPSYAYYAPSYVDPYYSSGPVITQNFSQSAAPPPQDYPPAPSDTVYREPIYLIAFRDHRIQAAIAYWVDGDTLHIVTREHEQKEIPLADIDRAFSEQLNRDRRVEFRLPR